MSDPKTLSTPTAILIGSVIIAAGLFFGLRERAPAPPPAAPSGTTVAAPQQPPQQAPAPPPAPPAVPREQVAKQVALALEKHRALLIEKCWKPSVEKQPTPASAKVTFNFTFDASGTMLARGL